MSWMQDTVKSKGGWNLKVKEWDDDPKEIQNINFNTEQFGCQWENKQARN